MVVPMERNWGWLVEELKREGGRIAAMNEKNGSSREKPWQQFQENQTAPEGPRDLQLFPNIRSTTTTPTNSRCQQPLCIQLYQGKMQSFGVEKNSCQGVR